MARVKVSGIISDIRGKVGGSVYQSSQGGLILKNKSGVISSSSSRSLKHKMGIARIQGNWRAITNEQRMLWEQYSIYLDKKQKHNPSIRVNGHQLFLNYNSIRYDLQEVAPLFNPYLLESPIMTTLPEPISIVSVVQGEVFLFVTLSRVINSLEEVIILSLSSSLLGSQNSQNQKMLLMKSATTSGNVFECSNYYKEVYGRKLEVGMYVQSRVAIWSVVNQSYSLFSRQRFEVL